MARRHSHRTIGRNEHRIQPTFTLVLYNQNEHPSGHRSHLLDMSPSNNMTYILTRKCDMRTTMRAKNTRTLPHTRIPPSRLPDRRNHYGSSRPRIRGYRKILETQLWAPRKHRQISQQRIQFTKIHRLTHNLPGRTRTPPRHNGLHMPLSVSTSLPYKSCKKLYRTHESSRKTKNTKTRNSLSKQIQTTSS